ncbi:MAG: hypothetical protein KIT16_10075 [Rhodospirillaceae bacterium]|nr:hypothetical protein [Rhodospirillaceae bacterium]
MATPSAQRKWREKNRFVKSQLNVMVRRLVHRDLEELANASALRGKGEAVSFASFVAKGLQQYAEHDPEARRLLGLFHNAYSRDRDLYR